MDDDAPVLCGIILLNIERFVLADLLSISTVYCDAVVACIVVKLQLFILYVSCNIFNMGAKLFVVHEEFDTICSPLYNS